MFSNTEAHQYLHLMTDIQRAKFCQLNLSEECQKLVSDYYQMSTRDNISTIELNQLGHIWRQAEKDEQLTQALVLVDELEPPCLKDDVLLSADRDLRTHLSEHVPVMAEEKLKQFRGDYEELDTQKPYVTMFCPDGSGIVHIPIDRDGVVSLDDLEELYQKTCNRCNKKFETHEKFIFLGDHFMSSMKH